MRENAKPRWRCGSWLTWCLIFRPVTRGIEMDAETEIRAEFAKLLYTDQELAAALPPIGEGL